MKRRNTASSKEILEILSHAEEALSHEMIQERMSESSDRATIYRTLNRFHEDGEVHKVIADDGKQYFAKCKNCGVQKKVHSHDHMHFRCLECGKVECLSSSVRPSLPKGYIGQVYNFMVSGLCAECA